MATETRPNILFICTDQQRYDALGCYGNEHISTPAIDGLAEEGVLFEQCYVQNPVCAPSRASLLTGRYPHAHGLWANGVALPEGETLFTRALADAEYDCGLIGKLHLAACYQGRTEPRHDDGFHVFEWAHDPTHGSPENACHRWLEEHHPDLYAAAMVNGPGRRGHDPVGFDTLPTEAHYSRWVGERTIDFLRQGRRADRPFFLMANFYDPHHPFVAPPEYRDRYDPAALPRPIGGPDDLADRPPILAAASRKSYAGIARGFAEYSPEGIQEIIAAYYAMVTLIDDEVRRILAALDDLGLAENTLVVFTSDHGEMLGDHGLLLKGPLMYEGAVRVPLILRWPGQLPAGTRRAELVQWIDLCATVLEAAGTPPLAGDQGQSLLPLARGDADAPGRGWALCEYRDSGHPYDPPVHVTMLRRGRHKLIVHHGLPATDRARGGELYDLAADPRELHNLWDDPAAAPIRVELQRMLLDVLVATEDRSQPREAYW
ncbi:MAG: sulfatase-like hydrolase/transferase [Chloroflexota bacterium]|nr:sulfatase-like hydrolase/transferase [Chloroflexota bacterium]